MILLSAAYNAFGVKLEYCMWNTVRFIQHTWILTVSLYCIFCVLWLNSTSHCHFTGQILDPWRVQYMYICVFVQGDCWSHNSYISLSQKSVTDFFWLQCSVEYLWSWTACIFPYYWLSLGRSFKILELQTLVLFPVMKYNTSV